jgi:threonine synthase
MVAVQASGCAPMVRAWEQGDEFATRWEEPATVATGIRVPKAVGDFLILRAVRESGGFAIAVEEEQISAELAAASEDGQLLCPEGAAVLAGWRSALERGLVGRGEKVVLFNCAAGNKYPLVPTAPHIRLAESHGASV